MRTSSVRRSFGTRASCYEVGRNTANIFAAPNRHGGGLNVLLADAAVRFTSPTINAGNAESPEWLSGPSRYTVWGALVGAGRMDGYAGFPIRLMASGL